MDEVAPMAGQSTPEGLQWPVLCAFCALWFSRNSYTLHYLTHPTAIIPDLIYLGNEENSKDLATLQKLGISWILNTASDCNNHFPEQFRYFNLNLDDEVTTPLLGALEEGIRILSDAEKCGAKTFVHCVVGASRSASIVIAYMMVRNDLSLRQAIEFVKRKRGLVRPNDGFVQQLGAYEVSLRGGIPTYPPKLGSGILTRQHSLPAPLLGARPSTPPLSGRPPPLRRINAGHSAPALIRKKHEDGKEARHVSQAPPIDVIPASGENTPEVVYQCYSCGEEFWLTKSRSYTAPPQGSDLLHVSMVPESNHKTDIGPMTRDHVAISGEGSKGAKPRRLSIAQRKASLDSNIPSEAVNVDGLEEVIRAMENTDTT